MNAESATHRPHWIVGYVCVIVFGAGVMAYAAVDVIRHPVSPIWLILVALTIVSDLAMLRNQATGFSYSVSDMFTISAALLFGPSVGALVAAVDGLVLSYKFSSSRRTFHRLLFNMSAITIATWVAAQVFVALVGRRPEIEGLVPALKLLGALTVFGFVDYAVNGGIIATAVTVQRRLPFMTVWREHFADLWLTYFGGVSGGMIMMLLSRLNAFYGLIGLVPLPVILYKAFRDALGRAQDQIIHLGSVNRVYVKAIEALAHAVDAKDEVTHEHVRRVQDRAVLLARALEVDDEPQVQAIKAAALLHDVGKLAIPEHILNKPGKLTPAEYEIMKRHAPIGADILSVIDFPYPVAPIVRHHHESWDGSGYPDGLAGDRIPIGARILAVVDCYDALTSDRPYRPRMNDRDAAQILTDRRGTMYDPRVVDAFFVLQRVQDSESSMRSAEDPHALPDRPPAASEHARPVPDASELHIALDRLLGAPFETSQLGPIVWTHLRPLLPASGFALYAYDPSSDAIVAVHAVMESSDSVPYAARIPVGERLSGWVAATGQTVVNSDARLDFDDTVREEVTFRSALAVRVSSNGRVLGVLTFYARDVRAFDDGHVSLVEAAGRMVSDAVTDSLLSTQLALPALSQNSTDGTKPHIS